MTFDIQSVGLPKWPALVVVGERVTPDQAKEILVRTDHWTLGTNDRAWAKLVRERIDLHDSWEATLSFEEIQKVWEQNVAWKKEHGVLSLHYLHNSRVASAYIGGPHGWCDWSGRIGCDSFNIGKWPSAGEVLEDWQAIARTFPFLSLRSQLFNGEGHEDGIRPIVEYVVAGGEVIAQKPTDKMMQPSEKDIGAFVASLALGLPGRERGCTIDVLVDAVEHVRRLMVVPAEGAK